MDSISRRAFVRRASVVTLALGGAFPRAAHAVSMNMRLGWLANAQYAGDFVALDKGFFKERGIELKIDPGGPSIDPISLTAGGSSTIGNVASIARASPSAAPLSISLKTRCERDSPKTTV